MPENIELRKARQARYWASLTPEQKTAKNKAKYDRMTPEQKTAKNKAKYDRMTPEQRTAKQTASRASNQAARLAAQPKDYTFVGIDGEAHKEQDGKSVYSYLRAGSLLPLVCREGL
jgi:hypothetical protein